MGKTGEFEGISKIYAKKGGNGSPRLESPPRTGERAPGYGPAQGKLPEGFDSIA
jgi:hypothetical protein